MGLFERRPQPGRHGLPQGTSRGGRTAAAGWAGRRRGWDRGFYERQESPEPEEEAPVDARHESNDTAAAEERGLQCPALTGM